MDVTALVLMRVIRSIGGPYFVDLMRIGTLRMMSSCETVRIGYV